VIDAGPLADLPERSVRIVRAGRREIGLIRWDGETLYAVHNRCPHQGGPICRGALMPNLAAADAGSTDAIAVNNDKPVLICPWHHWEFDLASGKALYAHPHKLRTYPVRLDGDRIVIDEHGHTGPSAGEP
jgi:nitrite reductase/ring-hydroxylating ferredoxin subunit